SSLIGTGGSKVAKLPYICPRSALLENGCCAALIRSRYARNRPIHDGSLAAAFRDQVGQREQSAPAEAVGELGQNLAGAIRELSGASAGALNAAVAVHERLHVCKRNGVVTAVPENAGHQISLKQSCLFQRVDQGERD